MSADPPDRQPSIGGSVQLETPPVDETTSSQTEGAQLPQGAEDPETFVAEWMDDFLNGEYMDAGLWEWFREEFRGWTRQMFEEVKRITRKRFKDALRQNGVYIGGEGGLPGQLFRALTEAEQAGWTMEEREKEITAARAKGEQWNSRWRPDIVADVAMLYKEAEEVYNRATGAETATGRLVNPVQPLQPHSSQPHFRQERTPARNETNPPLRRLHQLSLDPRREQSTASQRFPVAAPGNARLDSLSNALPTSNLPPVQTYDSGRAITTLLKIYDDRSKYHGSMDILDTKVMVFYDLCAKAGVREAEFTSACSAMFADDAKDFYYENIMNRNLEFPTVISLVRENFETLERQTKFMSHWNMTSLMEVKGRNGDKTLLECFDILYKELRQCQLTMDKEQQTDAFLKRRLLMACEGVEECKLAIFKPAHNLQALRDDIRHALSLSIPSRVSAFPSTTSAQVNVESFLTDRKYYDNSNKKHTGLLGKKCLVCEKPNCWSSNHPSDDQKAAFDKLARSKGIPQRIRQFVIEQEGTPAESIETYESLIDSLPLYSSEDRQNEAFYATYGIPDASVVFQELASHTVFHAISRTTRNKPKRAATMAEPTLKARYSADRFMGILVDTGAASRSTAGVGQFTALQRIQKVTLDKRRAGEAQITFGIGGSLSLGTVNVETPLGFVEFYVVPADVPFLLCLADMDRLRATYDNLKDVVKQEGRPQVPVFRMYGHPWILLDPVKSFVAQDNDISPSIECHLTETELRQLHRRFGHPSVARLERVLRRAEQDWESLELRKITEFCHHCQIHGRSPGRFKFTLKDDVDFNHSVYADICWIEGKPVLHVVDESTSFQAARFVKSLSAGHAWEAFRACWIDVYLGPPALITHDPGTNFSSDEFRGNAHSMGTDVKETPTEAHNSIGLVERYHVPLRRAFDIIAKEMPQLEKEARLQMAVKAVNDTAGPDGLTPTLLVFGAFPRLSREDRPTASNTQRAATIRHAMAEVRRCHAARKVADALRIRNGPEVSATLSLPLNSDVLIWREKEPYWSGPYTLLAIDKYTCKVQVNDKVVDLRITSVKLYKRDEKEDLLEVTDLADSSPSLETPPTEPYRRSFTRGQGDLAEPQISTEHILGKTKQRVAVEIPIPRINRDEYAIHSTDTMLQEVATRTESFLTCSFLTEKEQRDRQLAIDLRIKGVITTPGQPFEVSRRKEIDSLLGKGVFKIVQVSDIPWGTKIFNSRFVDEVKGKETATPYEKSRLVVQAYNDQGKSSILTQSPTIQRMSQRALLALAPSLVKQGMYVRLRDITQAYPQSTSRLNRLIYARPPKQIASELLTGTIFLVVIPLYGIPEAGAHWYGTYEKHHRIKLGMEQSTYDPCLMVTKAPDGPFGIVGLQTDDTLFIGDRRFVDLEDKELAAAGLMAKPAQTLTPQTPLAFNGCKLVMDVDGSISATPKDQGKRLSLVDIKSTTARQAYVEQRARGAYIATICQPEAAFDLSVAAQYQNPGKDDIKALNRRLKWQMDNQERGLRFIALPLPRAKLFVFVDGSFANNHDLSSQIGYIVTLGIEEETNSSFTWIGNVIGYSSTKCKRVTRAILASELYSMVAGVDMAISLSTTFALICRQLSINNFPVVVCTDSFSLYECLVKLGTTKEKRLMIDIMALRQSYERRELAEIRWIEGDSNPADAMTKSTPNKALEQMVSTNRLDIKVKGYVQRPDGVVRKEL